MYQKNFIIFLSISTFLFNINAQNQLDTGFIATFPSSVLPNSFAKFCIRFINIDSDVKFTVEDDEPKSFESFEQRISPNDPERCIDVKIDSNLTNVKGNKKIYVKGQTVSGSYTFEDSKVFTVKKVNYFTLIETDKPVYKPKDKVRIRFLTLDYELKPLKKIHNLIFVSDSSGSRVAQWLDVDNKNGLVDLVMPLSEEPNLGKWKIEIRENSDVDENLKVFFEVKKYVLPKFELTLNHKKMLKPSDKYINVDVCGKYSHGSSVKGIYEIQAYTKQFSYKTYKEELFKNVSKTVDGKGCNEFIFDLAELGFDSKSYLNTVYFTAHLTEADTEIKANASSQAEVSYSNLEIELIEPSYFKPGFPINFKLFVKSVDGVGMPSETIEMALEREGASFYSQNFTSNNEGFIEFTVDPLSINLTDSFSSPGAIYLRAEQKSPKKDSIKQERIFTLNPWLSTSNSYLQIYKPKESSINLNCLEMITNTIIIRSTKNQSTRKIYFQLQARSEVILSGQYNPETTKTILNNKNNDTFDLSFKLVKASVKNLPKSKAKKDESSRSEICSEELVFTNEEFDQANDKEENNGNTNDQKRAYAYYAPQPNPFKWYYEPKSNACKKLLKKPTKETKNKFNSKKLCEEECKISPAYSIIGQPMTNKNYKLDDIYENVYELSFRISNEMSPNLKVLVFYVDGQEIIPDSVNYKINKCFKNEVDLSLDFDVVQIGKRVEVTVKSEPRSLCAISAIDKSVSFMGDRNSIKIDKIFDKLSEFDLVYDSENKYATFESEDCDDDYYYPMPRPVPISNTRLNDRVLNARTKKKSIMYRPYESQNFHDPTKAFRDSNVVYLSDLKIYRECKTNPVYPIYYAMPRNGIMNGRGSLPQPMIMESMVDRFGASEAYVYKSTNDAKPKAENLILETVRQYFPETWLWNIYLSNEQGIIERAERVPDSITDWIFDSYCISEKSGIGISDSKILKVFQPLFVSIDLPYSVIRTEIFQVKASIFNFEKTCVPIQITIESDRRLALTKTTSNNVKTCICPDEKITQKFDMTALQFDLEKGFSIKTKVTSINEGGICNETQPVTKLVKFFDSETRSVLVEPEGIPKIHTESQFIVFKSNQVLKNQEIEIKIPENIVPRSVRGYLSLTGDSMGPVLNNLDKLVEQPTGCGEQNMIKFAPIKSVASYMKDTYQMTKAMNDKTQEYLKIGYQRQLTYRHQDGSFSAFGPSNSKESGGTWLTAFVLRVLAETYKLNHIKIDEKDLTLSLGMLMNTQNAEGCFQQVGAPLYSKALAGGLKDRKVGLSAYVLVSILKTIDALNLKSQEYDEKVNLGLAYLKSSVNDLQNADIYTLGLVLFAFKLANRQDDQEFIMKMSDEINRRAINEDGFTYWTESGQKKEKHDDSKSFWQINQSADLEITSYILLSKLYNYKNEDLTSIVPITKWINSQRNSMGGFYSTQDTCIALDALSHFATAFYSKSIDLKLNYNYNSKEDTVFINEKNRLLVQEVTLNRLKENEKNKFSFNVEGSGTALIQIILKYSLNNDSKSQEKKDDFEFSILASEIECEKAKLTIKAKYIGIKEASSMAIVSLRLPTGWIANEDSIESLRALVNLRRHEIDENKINLYFDELNHISKEFKIEVIKKFEIKNSKPGLLSVYDYYEPLDESTTQLFEIENKCV